jgi:N-methylhydantoinase A
VSGRDRSKRRESRSPRGSQSGAWLIGIDVGGTFTDAVAVSARGETHIAKVPSTPEDPALALTAAVRELAGLGVPLGRVLTLFHGTTVATNATITGRLGRVVLVTTEGYRDILSYRTGGRPSLYDLEQPRPRELAERRNRLEVRERLAWDGSIVTPLSEEEVERVVSEVRSRDFDAIAVSLLFSYMNDEHERTLERALGSAFPRSPVSVSSSVAREFREYPRTATTVLNAGLRPIVGGYLVRAQHEVHTLGVTHPFLIMQSNGGCVPAERADRESHRLLMSGPTAGVAGTIALGAAAGKDRLISLDMGGTSLDVCLINDGIPPVTAMQQLDTHPILAPTVDVTTVGAGGGSIARVDPTGRLRVGPDSAGANPGPAAYGRGGKEATLTDAHVVVGSLGDTPLAGRLPLDPDASRAAVGRLAEELKMDVEAVGEGIIAVAMAHVQRALRRVSVERGVDPREYTLVAFGGAGPLHASRLLRDMRLGAIVVPPHPGLFSASGLMASDVRIDDSRTVLRILEPATVPELTGWYSDASRRLTEQLREDGVSRSKMRLVGGVDCRYLGQGFELQVPLRGFRPDAFDRLAPDFHELHQRTYGHASREEAVELVTLRLSAFGALPTSKASSIEVGGPSPRKDALLGRRAVRLPGSARRSRIPIFGRDLLRARNRIDGPAIVEEMDSTTLILSGQRAKVDRLGHIWINEDALR